MIIAAIAQDGKKDDLYDHIDQNLAFYSEHQFIATKGSSSVLDLFGLDIVETVNRGIDGGDIQIAGMILNGDVAFVIFLANVKDNIPHWYDAHALVRVCIAEDIPFAMNPTTADLLIKGGL